MSKFKRGIILFFCAIGIAFIVGQYLKLDPNNTFLGLNYNSVAISREPPTNIKEQALFAKDITPVAKKFNGAESNTKTEIAITTSVQRLTAEQFPLGWYDRATNSQTPAKVAQEGMNLLVVYTNRHDEATIKTYLDAAQAAGMKVLLEPYRNKVKNGDIAAVNKFIRTFKQHPAVFGWYLYDEPRPSKVSPQTLKSVYKAIKAEEPNKPVAIVFGRGEFASEAKNYWNAFDIFMVDIYPIHYDKIEFDGLETFKKEIEDAAIAAGEKKFWFVLQAFGQEEDLKPNLLKKRRWRLPTAAEERYMLYTVILAEAKGLLFYAHHQTTQFWIDSVLKSIIQEFHTYIPVIKARSKTDSRLYKVSVKKAPIQTVLYQNPNNGDYLLITIHHGKEKVNASFKLPTDILASSDTVLREGRAVKMNQGTFSDSFNPYEVKIYTIR